MGTLLMSQASSFLREKYKAAKLAFTDVSQAESWVESVTNNDVWSPNAKIMTQIAEASYNFNDYWKTVDALHKRLNNIDWKKWRQSYNSLILLEFLITHGQEDFEMEFRCDIGVIKELGTFKYVDSRGVNWGMYMKSKVERIIKLMQGGSLLQEARSKAMKLTTEIQGFGSSSSSSLSSSSSPSNSWRSSFNSYSPLSTSWCDINYESNIKHKVQEIEKGDIIQHKMPKNFLEDGVTISDMLDWYSTPETFSEINLKDNNEDSDKRATLFQGICPKYVSYYSMSKDGGKIIFRSVSDIGRENKKIFDYKYSLHY